jgi:hypothetical protein
LEKEIEQRKRAEELLNERVIIHKSQSTTTKDQTRKTNQVKTLQIEKLSKYSIRAAALTLALTIGFALPARPDPITYILSGTATGTVGATPFTNAAFTIRVFADTKDVTHPTPEVYFLEDITSTLEIAGFPFAAFTLPEHMFVTEPDALGFQRSHDLGDDLLDIIDEQNAFATYDLRSSFGPVFEPFPQAVEQFTNEPTTIGNVTFASARDVTFRAIVVPEPSSLLLLGVGFSIALWYRRSGRQK